MIPEKEKAPVMTAAQFLALSLREQDAIVSEAILGCRVYESYEARRLAMKNKTHRFPDVTWIDGDEAFHLNGYEPGTTYAPWSPAALIEDAWMVVERMSGWTFAIEQFEQLDRWGAYFKNKVTWERVWGNADAAPLAICIAALKATGALIEGNGE